MHGKHPAFLETDYDGLDVSLNKRRMYKLADVADKVEKVAWDIVRFKDVDSDNLAKLWIVQQQDGENVIVAMYDDDDLEKAAASASPWAAVPDKNDNVNVFYKGEAIKRFAVSVLGLPNEDAHVVCRVLPKKLASDQKFRSSFLSSLSQKDRESLYARYPELH